jgi:hypothetical protein
MAGPVGFAFAKWKQRVPLPEVVRILLSEVQVAEMKLAQVRLEVVRFSGSQEHGPAILLRGEGIVTVAGKEDRVLLLADTASGFSGQWRKLSRGEVMQVPVKVVVNGKGISGALVVWQREGRQEGRFVSDEGSEGAQAQLVVQGLAAPQPNLPSSEYIVDFYADPYFTEWVGSFIRLCNGATSREGIQDGWTKTEDIAGCNGFGAQHYCWVKFCEDPNNMTTCSFYQTNCPGFLCSEPNVSCQPCLENTCVYPWP